MKLTIAAIVALALVALGAVAWVLLRPVAPPPPRPRHPAPIEDDDAISTRRSKPDASSAAPPAPSGGFIGGAVVDAGGRPIEGALVWAIGADQADVAVDAHAKTDRAGRFRLAASASGVRDVGASKPGWMPVLLRDVTIVPSARRDDLRIVLGEGAEISGHVRDPKGRGLAGARLACVAEAAREPSWREDSGRLPGRASLESITLVTRTDTSGAYAFRGLERGAAFRVSPIAGEFYTPGRTGDDRMRLVGAPASNVDFTMLASCVVVLHIVDGATDEPVGGCSIEITGPSIVTKRVPDIAQPTIRLDRELRPGRHHLIVEARCFEIAQRDFDLAEGAPQEMTVRLTRKEGVVPGTLIVRARDDGGAPVPDLCITASGVGGLVESVASDDEPADERSSGVREIRNVEPGEYRVEVTSKSRDYGTVEIDATVRANDATTLDVTVAAAGRLSVEVKNVDGEWLAGYRVELRRDDGKPTDADIRLPAGSGGARISKGVVDARGPLDIGRVQPGLVTVVISCPGFDTATETADVRRGEETKVAIALRKAP